MKREMKRAENENGFVLLSTAACIMAIVAMMGVAVDLGRLYVAKSELQGYADTAAMAAAYELDGTQQGISRATAVAQNGGIGGIRPNRWNFATQPVSSPQITFAKVLAGPYSSAPADASGVLFAQIQLAETLPIYFLRGLPGIGSTTALSVSAIAGQAIRNSLGDGLAPFSPDAHNAADPNFGFSIGDNYTLKWPAPGQSGKPGAICSGDVPFNPNGGASDRGYLDVGQGAGDSGLVSTIVNNDFFLQSPLKIGDPITFVTGAKHVGPAIQQRIDQDSDTTSTSFSSYSGNGRRILITTVNDNLVPPHVAGFAAFFLHLNACSTGNSGSCCGEYIGPALEFSSHKGAALGGGLYVPVLFR